MVNVEAEKDDVALPILFEECYALAESQQFLDRIKKSASITGALPSKIEEHKEYYGMHLFVMQHGFQGN